MGKQHKKLWTVLFIILNIAVIAYIAFSEFYGEDSVDVAPQFAANWWLYILCAFVCLLILLAAETAKYAYMMRVLGEKVSLRTAFETAALGKYYDCITPSGAGGQPFQIFWLHKNGYSAGAASAMPITGFITMQAGFILLALTIFTTWRSVEVETIRYTAYLGLIAYMIVPGLLIAFSFKPKAVVKLVSWFIHLGGKLHIVKDPDAVTEGTIDKLSEFQESFRLISRRKRDVVVLMAFALIYQTALCAIACFVLKSVGGQDGFWHVFAAIVYIYATVTIIVTPGNSGAAEGVFYIVFSAIGSEGVFWAMIIWRLMTYYSFIVIGAVIYGINALSGRRTQKVKNEQ